MDDIKRKRIDQLHDKFFYGNITEVEEKELLEEYRWLFAGSVSDDPIRDFLYTSHPDYGKPDKDGKVTIV